MLKKSVSFVLASLRGSTYRTEYASPLRLLRSLLNGLFEHPTGYSSVVYHLNLWAIGFPACHDSFSATCQTPLSAFPCFLATLWRLG